MADEQVFVDRTRSEVRTFLNSYETLVNALAEYDRLGSATNPDLDAVVWNDIDKVKFIAVFNTVSSFKALMDGPHGTVLYEGAA